jgi:hypothetical protein
MIPPACGSTRPPGRERGSGDDPHHGTTRLTQDTRDAPAFGAATAVVDRVAWRTDNPGSRSRHA